MNKEKILESCVAIEKMLKDIQKEAVYYRDIDSVERQLNEIRKEVSEKDEAARVENAVIRDITLTMADHNSLVFYLELEGSGWGCMYGGYSLGKGSLGAKVFKGYACGVECLMRVMDVVGVSKWEDLKGKYCRVVLPRDKMITTIGNLIEDKWFDCADYYAKNF